MIFKTPVQLTFKLFITLQHLIVETDRCLRL